MGTIEVFDFSDKAFLPLDKSNYDDDLIAGAVYFARDAIEIITESVNVIGYLMIDKDSVCYPIDIRNNEIAMLEGTYNCLPSPLKEIIIPYNLKSVPKTIWSPFFLKWQFMCDWNVFETNGSFIELSSRIISDVKILEKLMDENINIIFPRDYKELSVLVCSLERLFGFDFYNKDYYEDVNYLFDSLTNGYHVNMNSAEVETHTFRVCDLVLKHMGWRNE